MATIVALRRKGRTFSYIAEEIGVCRDVISRELRAQGMTPATSRPTAAPTAGAGSGVASTIECRRAAGRILSGRWLQRCGNDLGRGYNASPQRLRRLPSHRVCPGTPNVLTSYPMSPYFIPSHTM